MAKRRGCGEWWLRFFFWWARYAPWGPRLTRHFWTGLAWRASPYLRDVTTANAAHLLGPDSTPAEHTALGKRINLDFYQFVCDVGRSQGLSRERLLARIDGVEGAERYLEARKAGRGAVLVTAHLGNFEVGLAEITRIEPKVHVVFQRDQVGRFEEIRSALRRRLGVIETPIDDGMASWAALRDALEADAVVMLQGDRAMPGQKAQAVPFFDGQLRVPVGPAKLAWMTGSPLIPVFAINRPGGRVHIKLGEPIMVREPADVAEATLRVGRAIEAEVRAHPEQWHVLHKAFVEDGGDATGPYAGLADESRAKGR